MRPSSSSRLCAPLTLPYAPTMNGPRLNAAVLRRWSICSAALALSSAALAHYPHDVSYWAAISPDPVRPRFVTSLERIDLDILGRSEDGLDWAARLVGAVSDGHVRTAALLTPDRLVLGTMNRGLLVSEDGGDTIASEPTVTDTDIVRLAASPTVGVDGVAFAIGETAIWRTADAGLSWDAVLDTDDTGFNDIGVSPEFAQDGRVCATERAALACSDDGGLTWARTALPERTYRISVGAEHRVWAVVRDEGLHLSEDDGESWELSAFEGEDVTSIAELSDGLVLVASAQRAGYRSTDGGRTWTLVDVLRTSADQGVDGVHFFDFFEGPDGAVYLTCWDGLARSEDRGLTYHFYATERPQNTHSVVLTRGDGDTLSAWLGTYGSGPLLTNLDTLATEDFPNLLVRFTRNTMVSPTWGDDGIAVFDEGYSTWRTTDAGATWATIATNPIDDGDVTLQTDVKGVALSPDPGADPFVLAIVGQMAMSFQVSEDLGDTWTTGTQEPACERDGFAVALSPDWPEESRAWAACGGAIYESVDRGASWTEIGDTGAAFVFRIERQNGGALLVATSDGLWRLDGGVTSRVAFTGQVVVALAASTTLGDETLFALVPAVGWWRSDDGGAAWTELSAPTADVPRMVAMSPSFAEDGIVAVAGYGGAWASFDRGETWSSIYAEEVFESFLDTWTTSGRWENPLLEGASGGEITVTDEPGAKKTLEFRGIAAVLEAPADAAPGVVAVSLDGASAELVSLPTGSRTIWRADNLQDTWHTLTVEASFGTATLDDVRVTRLAEIAAAPAEDDAPSTAAKGTRCGCSEGHGAVLLLLPLAGLRRRATLGPARRSFAKALGDEG